TENGGREWRKARVEARDHFYDVDFGGEDKLTGWAVGTYGRIVHTTDGGKTWSEQSADTKEHLRTVVVRDKEGVAAAGEHGVVLLTGDAGKTWTTHFPCGSVELND